MVGFDCVQYMTCDRDDLLVTNPKRVKEGQEKKACNCLLLKINQVGTMSESIEACKIAKAAGWGIMVSHRSGDTEDPFIADMCVGLNAGQVIAQFVSVFLT